LAGQIWPAGRRLIGAGLHRQGDNEGSTHSSETSVYLNETTWRCIPESCRLYFCVSVSQLYIQGRRKTKKTKKKYKSNRKLQTELKKLPRNNIDIQLKVS
jgi:hypothetical protein